MTVWLGRPGSLVAIKSPLRDVDVSIVRQSTSRTTLGGGRSKDFAPGQLREWTFNYRWLSRDDAGSLTAYVAGHHGPGPWALIDGIEQNLLTPQQSSAGCADLSPDGFEISGGHAEVTSMPIGLHSPRGPVYLVWDVPSGGGTLWPSAQHDGWLGVPVVPGQAYRWQAYVAGWMLALARIYWLSQSGEVISSVSGSTSIRMPGSLAFAQGTAPAGAVWASPRILAGADQSIGVDGVGLVVRSFARPLAIDQLQWSMVTSVDDGTVWAPGLGIPLVTAEFSSVTAVTDLRSDRAVQLTEVR